MGIAVVGGALMAPPAAGGSMGVMGPPAGLGAFGPRAVSVSSQQPASAAPTFGPTYPGTVAGWPGWGATVDLAFSKRRGSTLLHAVTLKGPMDPDRYDEAVAVVSYARSANQGRSWTQSARLSPARATKGDAVTGPGFAVAAAGKRVYVSYVTSSYPRQGDPRYYLNVRVNTAFGASSRWRPVRRLRVPQPVSTYFWDGTLSLAATRSTVFIAARVDTRLFLWTSRDGGSRWSKRQVATTWTEGRVAVAANGSLTAIAWVRGRSVRVKISRDGGRHWGQARRVGTSGSGLSLAARNGRVAVAASLPMTPYDPPMSTWTRTWRKGAWLPQRVVLDSGNTYGEVNPFNTGVQVLLQGESDLGVAYPVVRGAPSGDIVTHLLWRASADDGRSWTDPRGVVSVAQREDSSGRSVGKQLYDYSAVWQSAGKIHILFAIRTAVDVGSEDLRITYSTFIRSSA